MMPTSPASLQLLEKIPDHFGHHSGISGNLSELKSEPCPICSGITVRNELELVSELNRNYCPNWPGIHTYWKLLEKTKMKR
jgi:hypothetical protein